MNFTTVDQTMFANAELVAESGQFALYAEGHQRYLLVQRHEAESWTALEVSGDGLFRVAELFSAGMRHAYKNVSSRLEPRANGVTKRA